ncbi:MAG: hypothetical protein IJY99_01200 [Alphaproteobacteria bacterium]|nr:hypothetical protein [Alphaproteobacteria bacterium]
MMLIETLFDLISASAGAIIGAFVAFLLNRSRNKKMANQLVISRQALEKIKLENEELLTRIQEKENLILQMQVQILGRHAKAKKSPKK